MGIFNKKTEKNWVDIIIEKFSDENYIEAICIAHAVDLISRSIASTELQVFRYEKNSNSRKYKTSKRNRALD